MNEQEIKITVKEAGEAADQVRRIAKSPLAIILLGGERWSWVEKVVTAEAGGEIAGVATIAPQGGQGTGDPAIIALYVPHQWRRRGIGSRLLEAAVDYMTSAGLTPIHIDVLSSAAARLVDRLPPEKRAQLVVSHHHLSLPEITLLDAPTLEEESRS